MENDKPFKTIEVVDSKTKQLCKVACMSCIRGHRTTSCGMPVCRNKVFWTVKRPGRPSNSCTCRYGATGGCKCGVARSACPHKAKKGEKRSGECRCDEQGRYCCLLEIPHWTAIISLNHPTVDFHASREALDAHRGISTPATAPATPSQSVSSPRSLGSAVGTPLPSNMTQVYQDLSMPQHVLASPQTPGLTPRFGMMGIGAPQGSADFTTADVLAWQGDAPETSIHYQSSPYEQPAPQSSCCQGPSSDQQAQPTQYMTSLSQASIPPPLFPDYSDITPLVNMPQQQNLATTIFDFNKLSNDYLAYQFPSAICQTCGLSGCTCRNCPPVMQNFNTGSWAQCCGRKHARTANYVPANVPAAFELPQKQPPSQSMVESRTEIQDEKSRSAFQHTEAMPDTEEAGGEFDYPPFDVNEDFALPTDTNNLDLSEFLMSDLERPPEGGCCCGDP